jgi:hypothetical protein
MRKTLTISFLIILLLLSLTFGCQDKETKPTIDIAKDKVGFIGYGSLLSLNNMEQTLGRKYEDSIYRVSVNGYERVWNFAGSTKDPKLPEELLNFDCYFVKGSDTILFNNVVFLNIESNKESKINSVLYFITPEELEKFDEMELGYERIDVTNNIEEYNFNGGKIYAYKALPNYTLSSVKKGDKNIIDKEYYNLVINACDSLGETFRKEFEASTKPIDTILIAPIVYRKINDSTKTNF